MIDPAMSEHGTFVQHEHTHGPDCGHMALQHAGHTDYIQEGHLQHLQDGHTEECVIAVDATNPAACTPDHRCAGHEAGHVHGPSCGHLAIPHGDHLDYLIDGHLHHPHGGHCDHHGAVHLVE